MDIIPSRIIVKKNNKYISKLYKNLLEKYLNKESHKTRKEALDSNDMSFEERMILNI